MFGLLEEIQLSVNGPNIFRDLASKTGCQLNLVDCRNFDSRGMALLVEVSGDNSAQFLKELATTPQVQRVYPAEFRDGKALVMIMTDPPVYCDTAKEAGAFCVTCPFKTFGEEDEVASWKLLAKDTGVMSRIIDMLEKQDIRAELRDLSRVYHKDTLTQRQREVMIEALKRGYFDFPREIDLTTLAYELNIRSSTLSEIMRRAESKVTRHYVESISE